MASYILAFDLGTGGNKSSLYTLEGACLAETLKATILFIREPVGMNKPLRIGGMLWWIVHAS